METVAPETGVEIIHGKVVDAGRGAQRVTVVVFGGCSENGCRLFLAPSFNYREVDDVSPKLGELFPDGIDL